MERVKARHQTMQGNACCGGLQSREHFGAWVAVHVTRVSEASMEIEAFQEISAEREVSPHFCGLDGMQVVKAPSGSPHQITGSQGDLRTTHPPPTLLQSTWVGEASIVITISLCLLILRGKSSMPRAGWRETKVVNTWKLFKNQKYSIK